MRGKLSYWFRLALIVLCLGTPFAQPQTAEARRRTGINDALTEKDTSKSYALPYGLVILGVTLGVLIIARPGTRLDSPKVKVHDEEED